METKKCKYCNQEVLYECADPHDCILGNHPVERLVIPDLRDQFTQNAEEFDSLMIMMLTENESLKKRCATVTDISERMPHLKIPGIEKVHVLPAALIQDVADGKRDITQIDDWADFLPTICKEWLNGF